MLYYSGQTRRIGGKIRFLLMLKQLDLFHPFKVSNSPILCPPA